MTINPIVGVSLVLALSLRPLDRRPQAAVPASAAVQNGIDLDEIVTRFFASSDEYEKTFRNLVAEETKTIEVYRASGEVEKRRQIVSDLLVYRSSRDGKEMATEYRDVRSVDGKAVEKRGERALKLLRNASKADSLDKELETINHETYRYEFTRHLRGGTIGQGGLTKRRREAFQIEWLAASRLPDTMPSCSVTGRRRRFRAPSPRCVCQRSLARPRFLPEAGSGSMPRQGSCGGTCGSWSCITPPLPSPSS